MVESTELLRKLQVKAGARLWLVNVPIELAEALTAGAEVEPVRASEPYDGAVVFCATPAEVEAVAERVIGGLPEDGLLWFCYRKGAAGKAAGLTRDVGWEAVKALGFDVVRSVAIDDAWTGLRFRKR
jgi:hypothetical protein